MILCKDQSINQSTNHTFPNNKTKQNRTQQQQLTLGKAGLLQQTDTVYRSVGMGGACLILPGGRAPAQVRQVAIDLIPVGVQRNGCLPGIIS